MGPEPQRNLLTSSVNKTGQKTVRLCGDRRHRSTRRHRYTSLCTTAEGTFLKISASFSTTDGSWLRWWFFSPVRRMYDSRLRLSDWSNISYSRLVKMFAEGATATLPGVWSISMWRRLESINGAHRASP
jgi:hypothetical protein